MDDLDTSYGKTPDSAIVWPGCQGYGKLERGTSFARRSLACAFRSASFLRTYFPVHHPEDIT